MTRLLLHDAGDAGKLGWALQTIARKHACGMVLSAFESPPSDIPRRQSAGTLSAALRVEKAEVYFDPVTYGAVLPSASKFLYYDLWNLWPAGSRGNLSTPARRTAHVTRALEIAANIKATAIVPTVSLAHPTGAVAENVLKMMGTALAIENDAVVTLVGTEEFWRSGADLDSYVGRIASLRPNAFSVCVIRQTQHYPYLERHPDEIFGLCRTVHTLSLRGAIGIAAYGDLAALTSVAAGADRVGTGWNLGQRQLSHELFRSTSGGTASFRPTYEGLVAAFKAVEAQRFEAANAFESNRHYPGPLPPTLDKNGHWQHHLEVLDGIVDSVASSPASRRDLRSRRLARIYRSATTAFATASPAAAPLEADVQHWIEPVEQGLSQYMTDENY